MLQNYGGVSRFSFSAVVKRTRTLVLTFLVCVLTLFLFDYISSSLPSGASSHVAPPEKISRLPDDAAKCSRHLAIVQVFLDRRDGLHESHQHHHVFAVLLCDRGNGCRPTVTEEPVERAFWSHSVEWQAAIRVPNQLVSTALRCTGSNCPRWLDAAANGTGRGSRWAC